MRKVLMGLTVILLCAALGSVTQAKSGVVIYEVWQNLPAPGAGQPPLEPLRTDPDFPFNPDLRYEMTSWAGARDWADNYGARLYGYITIPATGNYNFYIGTDDEGELLLSVEGWPDLAVPVASVPTYCAESPPSWLEFPEQKSATFSLQQGQVIYLEGNMREGGGNDHFYIGWQGPGIALDTIPGLYTSDAHPRAASNPSPAHGATLVAADAQLAWDAPADVNELATYTVYFGTDPNVLTMPVLVSDISELTADPGPLDKGVTYYWRVEVTHSNYGNPFTVRGNLWQFTTIPPVPVIVTQPQDVFIKPGETAVFTVEATSDSPMSFQWYQEGVGAIDGATTNTLTIENAQAEGQFYCEVTNDGGTTTSDTAALHLERLIAYWPLDGDFNDASGLGPDGTFFGPDSNDLFSEGVAGQALGINLDTPKGQYVVFGSVGITGEMPRTIACWAKNSVPAAQIADWCNIFGFTSPTATGEQSFDFNKRGGQTQYCIHRYGAEWNMHEIDDEWHFLVATYENDTVTWYVDGVLGGSATTNLQTQDIVHLGKRAHSDPVWQGWVDEARIYNYALDAYEVAQLYIDVVPDAVICPEYDAADLNKDCKVNLADFAELAAVWMQCGRIPVSECTDGSGE